MEENKNIEEEGTSLKDIFGWIFKGKIPGLIVAGVSFILLLIVLLCFISPSGEVYEVEFQYTSIPGLNDGAYIDGTRFNYQDIIVEENVNKIIENNKLQYSEGKTTHNYSKIDLAELFGSNNFTVNMRRVYWDKEDDNAEPELKEVRYFMTLPPKAFPSNEIARAFAKDLIEYPLIKTQEMIATMDFTTNLTMYSEVQSFETKLSYLQKQVSLLEDGYNSLNGSVGGTQYTIDGVTYNFQAIVARIDDYLSTQNYSIMEAELRQNGYVNDKELASQRYAIEMDDLEKEHTYLEGQLAKVNATYNEAKDALQNIGGNVVSTDQVLSLLTQINETLLNKRMDLESQILKNEEEQRKLNIKIDALNNLSDADNQAFKARLDAIHNRLTTETATYDKVYKAITTRNMYVYYTNSNIIITTGGLSPIISIGAPIIVALIGFVVVSWVWGYIKSNKENKKALEEAKN